MLGIFVLPPQGVFIHDEGYIEKEEFYSRVMEGSNSTALTIRELLDIPYWQEDGAYRGYEKQTGEGKELHVHYYVNKEAENIYPANQFIRGHEQAHLLQPRILNQREFWYANLTQQGYTIAGIEALADEEEIADLGGLVALQLRGVAVGDEHNEVWQSFAQQAHRRTKQQSFANALAWHQMHWR